MNKISVVIPAYNAEKYISKALESVLAQTVPVHEIIVVDDCSNDHTYCIVEKFSKDFSTIKLLKQTYNSGVSSTRNRGIKEANGDWILFLDSDDECAPNLIEVYLENIQHSSFREKVSMIYPAYQQINEKSQIISDVLKGKKLIGDEGFCDVLIRNPIISPSGVIVRRNLLDEGFKTELSFNEDVELWLRLLNDNFIIEYIDKPLSFIRRHLSNTTSSMHISHQAEKVIMNQYGIDVIKEKLFGRDLSFEENSLDYALFLIRYDEWKKCGELLNTLVINQDSSKYITYCFLRSLCFIKEKKYRKALYLYKEILKFNSNHGAALNNIAIIYALDGDIKRAEQYFNQALLVFPNYLDVKHNYKLLKNGVLDYSQYRFTLRELRPVLLSYSTD